MRIRNICNNYIFYFSQSINRRDVYDYFTRWIVDLLTLTYSSSIAVFWEPKFRPTATFLSVSSETASYQMTVDHSSREIVETTL